MIRRLLFPTLLVVAIASCQRETTEPSGPIPPPRIMVGPCVVRFRFYVDSLDRSKGSVSLWSKFDPCPDTIEVFPGTEIPAAR